MNIHLNEVGTTKPLILPKRSIRGYYKDFLTGETKVQVNDKEYSVRDSLIEIQYLMGVNK
jgi:alpha-acetolactate decarboxylase